jgi:hypothetical protein
MEAEAIGAAMIRDRCIEYLNAQSQDVRCVFETLIGAIASREVSANEILDAIHADDRQSKVLNMIFAEADTTVEELLTAIERKEQSAYASV